MTVAVMIFGFLILVLLAGYAGILLLRLRKQTAQRVELQQKQEAAAKAKTDELLDSIRYIATAMIEERCEVSEGVIRIAKLFELLAMSESVSPEFPSLFKHFDRIREHPIKEQRKALSKQQRMKLDFERMKSESELEDQILDDARKLMNFSQPAVH